ncbi:septal ring factor EnvC (AmiA/AmiB activator) [Bradyrhizobium sp. F1.13.1]
MTELRIAQADPTAIKIVRGELEAAERDAAETADAISRLDTEIARLVAEEAAAADRKVREQTAATLAKYEASINHAAVTLIKALHAFADATDPVVPTVIDAAQTNILTRRLAHEFPAATALVTSMIRHHAAEVISGSAPSTIRKPEVAQPAQPRPSACFTTDDHGSPQIGFAKVS